MLAGRHSLEGKQAHAALVRSLWADPEFRLKVARTKAIRGSRRDHAFVAAARFDMMELDRRAAWAAKRRAVRAAKIQTLEDEVLRARIAAELGIKPA